MSRLRGRKVKDMAENIQPQRQTLPDIIAPIMGSYGSSIVVPKIIATTFKLEPSLINMIHLSLRFKCIPLIFFLKFLPSSLIIYALFLFQILFVRSDSFIFLQCPFYIKHSIILSFFTLKGYPFIQRQKMRGN